jgi:hypothetical protein
VAGVSGVASDAVYRPAAAQTMMRNRDADDAGVAFCVPQYLSSLASPRFSGMIMQPPRCNSTSTLIFFCQTLRSTV